MKQLKDKIFLLLIACFVLYFIFDPYVKNTILSLINGNSVSIEKSFVLESDWIAQHIPFYKEFFRQIDTGRIGWSWNELFGINFYASKGYYLTGDVFAWISYVLYKLIGNLHESLLLITLVKLLISALGFQIFLQVRGINRSGRFIFSIMFMLSGWQILFLEHPVYTSFYCTTPFVLIGLEIILQKKKYIYFIISSALMLVTNYYLSWMFCWFILIYWIIRYIESSEKNNIVDFTRLSLKTIAAFFVAIALSSFVWLPSLLHIIRSPRVNHELISYTSWNLDNLLSIIMNFFVPVTKEYNLYQFYWYYFYQIGIYCGVLNLLLLPQLFKKNNKFNNKLYLAFIVVILSTLSSPIVGKLFHFTYSLRYSMIVEYSLLIVGSLIYSKMKQVNLKILWATEIIILLLMFTIGIFIPLLKGINVGSYPQAKMLVWCAIFTLLYSLFLSYKKKNVGISTIGIVIVVLCEMVIQSRTVTLTQFSVGLRTEYLNKEEEVEKVIRALKNYDSSFYRIYLDFGELNTGLYYGIPVTKTYDSVYEYDNRDFLNYIRTYPDIDWNFDINDPALFERLNVKYAIVGPGVDESIYFGQKLDTLISSEFKVFQVSETAFMMRTENKFVNSKTLEFMSENDQDYYLYEITNMLSEKCVVLENESYYNEKYQDNTIQYANPVSWDNNTMIFDLELKEDSFLYFSIPNDMGWIVYENGRQLSKINVNGGFIGIEVSRGSHHLEFIYIVPGLKLGYLITSIGLLLLVLEFIRERLYCDNKEIRKV